MFGAIYGDIFGSVFEFNISEEVKSSCDFLHIISTWTAACQHTADP